MFAKLKKKVIEENGGRGMEGGDRTLSASPGTPALPGAAARNPGEVVGGGGDDVVVVVVVSWCLFLTPAKKLCESKFCQCFST